LPCLQLPARSGKSLTNQASVQGSACADDMEGRTMSKGAVFLLARLPFWAPACNLGSRQTPTPPTVGPAATPTLPGRDEVWRKRRPCR
jgi:hypothetical protein